MKNRVAFGFGILLACAVAVGILSNRAVGQANKTSAESETKRFEAKYAAIELDRALDKDATWVYEPRTQSIGSEQFLVGKIFSFTDDGKDEIGLPVWISTRHITQIYVYDDSAELKKWREKAAE